jgi:hypothetical protein
MATKTFVIRRKGSLEYFAGFADGEPLFGDERQARTFNDHTMASAQALLLRSDDDRVQVRPVVLA